MPLTPDDYQVYIGPAVVKAMFELWVEEHNWELFEIPSHPQDLRTFAIRSKSLALKG